MPDRRPVDDDVDVNLAPDLPNAQLLLAGLLALKLRGRARDTEGAEEVPAELVLVELGMSLGQIARLSGRNYQTVRSTIRRARARVAGTAQVASGVSKGKGRAGSDGG